MDQFYDPATVATLKGAFRFIVPEAMLLVVACVLFLGGTVRRGNRHIWGGVALAGLAAAVIAAFVGPSAAAAKGFVPTVSPISPDSLAQFTRGLALVGGVLLVLLELGRSPGRRCRRISRLPAADRRWDVAHGICQ